jgi:hypothetical protein
MAVGPALMLAGLVWGAGNVLADIGAGGPTFLAVLGPVLIGLAAVGNLLFTIYKDYRQRRGG